MLVARPHTFPVTERPSGRSITNSTIENTAFDFEFCSLERTPLPLKQFEGRVLLIVNTASKCGFTPQYNGLQKLHETYYAQGLTVIGVPSNNFANEEPGNSKEIAATCFRRHGVTFPVTQKEYVIGMQAHAFYRSAELTTKGQGTPKWNFHKYLIRREGQLAGSFPSLTSPTSRRLISSIEAELEHTAGQVMNA